MLLGQTYLKRRISDHPINGREGTSIFVASSFGPEKQRSKLPQDKATMGEPSTGLIHQGAAASQSRHRAAPQPTSSADSADSFGGGAAVVGGSGVE